MNLFTHELTHIFLSLFSGFIIWKLISNKQKFLLVSLISGIIGGFLIDLDHFVDYFLAFPYTLNINYFLKGYQFLKSDKIYVPLHSYELILFLLITSIALWNMSLRAKRSNPKQNLFFTSIIVFILSLSMFSHIALDIVDNELPIPTYSLIYRINKNFEIKNLVYPDHYRYHLEQKKILKVLSL